MNVHFLGFAVLTYVVVTAMQFIVGTIAATVFHNPTAARMLGGGSFANAGAA